MLVDSYATFFSEKIQGIRDSFSPSCAPSCSLLPAGVPALDFFDPVTIDETVQILSETKSKTYCVLDPIPTWLLKKYAYLIPPFFCYIANQSLSSGIFPQCEKRALVTPLIEKSSLAKDDLSSYRPISNISFLSKFLERVVAKRIDWFRLFQYDLMSPYQSAYRPQHSTETVLLRLCNDIAFARSERMLTCVIMLDLLGRV